MAREKVFPIYLDEARDLKARVYDLSEIGLKQVLFGMIQILTLKTSITQAQFKEILDDAGKYSQIKKEG
ncbi:MAG: hypothetical protein KG012_14205 [Deltaproteobacteria bacterium]|nr:hypothetical protein [Deltaproteobacteria bacterium]